MKKSSGKIHSFIHRIECFIKTKKILFLPFLLLSANLFAQWPGNAPVNPPADSFRIDGTLKVTNSLGDWLQGTTGTGGYVLQPTAGVWGPVNVNTTTFVRDSFNNTADRIFTGSSFSDNPNTWKWTTGKPTSKCDIATAMYHVSSSPTSKWIILGGDRWSTSGTSYIDFEFNQGFLTRRTDSNLFRYTAPPGKVLKNGRILGDFVLSMEYSNGGVNATVHYYTWDSTGPTTFKYVEHPIPVIALPLQPAGAVSSYGKTNGDSTDVPYGAFGLFKYEPFAFVEAAVNIDAILGGSCAGSGLNINSIFVKTKASDAYNASLKDFVEPVQVAFHFGTESMNYGDGTFCKSEGTATPTKSGTGTFTASKYGTDSLSPGVVWVGGGSSSTTGVIDLSASAADTFVISYTFSAGGGCSGVQKDTIYINDASSGTIGNSQTICSGGDPAAFTSTLAGSGAGIITYQWQSSTGTCEAGTFTNVASNGTSATYDPPSGLATTTRYRRIAISTINGEACRDTTDCVTVTVNSITAGTIAADQTICSGGDPAAFTAPGATTASGALSYQWQSSTGADCSSGFSNIAGATSATYDVPSGLTVTTRYRRVDTSTLNGVKCTAITNCVVVTVNNITAGAILADQTICSGGDPAAFTVQTAATGSGALTYQWQSSTGANCTTGFSNIAGATSATYDPPSGLTVTTRYRRIDTSTVSGQKCTAITNCVVVTVNSITAGVIAANQTICSGGDPAAFTVQTPASGSGSLSYQWQSSTGADCNTGFTSIAGATGATYDPPSGLTTTTRYRRIDTSTVNGQKCTAITNCVVVSVNNITPGTIASNQTLCSGGDPAAFTVSVAATGSGPITYQWQSSTGANCNAAFSNIAGATGATYNPPPGPDGTTYYHRVDTSTLNGVKCWGITNCVSVTINPAPSTPGIAFHPPDCDDSTFSITISSVTAGASYTLVDKNGNPIPKALPASPYIAPNSNSFDFTNIPAGSGYSVTVSSNGCGPANAPLACGNPTSAAKVGNRQLTTEVTSENTAVKAYPNPFSDKINFVVTTQKGGQGTLEVFNFMGQKVKTVYTGFISSGTQTFELNLPAKQIANLVYVLRIGTEKITGKLLQLNQ